MKFSWKKRLATSHKGQNGKILVIGGSEQYVGSPALAAMAAMRAGADWVTIAAPEKVAYAINSYSPDFITHKLKGSHLSKAHISDLVRLSKSHDVTLIGNGLTRTSSILSVIKTLVSKIKTPVVADADALHALNIKQCNNTIFTPHAKEAEILIKNSKFPKISELIKFPSKAKHLGTNVILLKGPTDYIISRLGTSKSQTGNPGMTHAGCGDVLAGVVSCFVSQHYDLATAAHMAANVNGFAGDILEADCGYGFTAWDLAHTISRAMIEINAWK